MKNAVENIILWIALRSYLLEGFGLGLIFLVTIWDIVLRGATKFPNYAIDWKGVITIWVGVLLICLSKKVRQSLEK